MIQHRFTAVFLGFVSAISMSSASAGEPPPRVPTPAQVPAAKPATADKMLYDTEDPTIIKKSRNNICHDRTSGAFALTTAFKAYRTMKDCLESGGRLPR